MISENIRRELKEIKKKLDEIKRCIEDLEDIILPSEKITEEELREIKKLKKESLKGKYVKWDELKEEIL
ncbi:MAG: hypothetical protein QXE46_05995 [Candidatus Thermoplasmatota archaeon]